MRCHSILVQVLAGLVSLAAIAAEFMYDCPLGWHIYENSCYHFVFFPKLSYLEATASCKVDGAELVSVNSQGEYTFVSDWLTQHDQNRDNNWWTSGQGEGERMTWQGDETAIKSLQEYWTDPSDVTVESGSHIVYTYNAIESRFKWSRQEAGAALPYVCEIGLTESYRVLHEDRDHMFGTNLTDPNDVELGPKFTVQPWTLVVLERDPEVILECVAHGNPPPSYTWFKDSETSPTPVRGSGRYTITNGKFLIQKPVKSADHGLYQCLAQNKIGAVLSDPVRVVFGYLAEFSNDPPGAVTAALYQGTALSCDPPAFNPALHYAWYKSGTGPSFMRTDLHPHLFTSVNGKLYISETSPMDAGFYHCMVTLVAPPGQRMAYSQSPSGNSMGIQLIITGEAPGDFDPLIHDDFPLVSPTPSLRGQTLVLECFAYGRLPLVYHWSKDNGPLPEKGVLSEHGRRLTLSDAQLEDAGNYTCRAQRGASAVHEKTLRLVVEATPFFIYPLSDQHVDMDQALSWRCEARGHPTPTYSWYKDGKKLTAKENNSIQVRGNVLSITRTDPKRHQGMYQCKASNVHGSRYTSAQLRVLAFPPSFARTPLNPSQFGTIGGSVTILCQPEAAPAAIMTWKKNDWDVVASTGGRVYQLANGNLVIQDVQLSDQGKYTCTAINKFGMASSDGLLTVVERPVINIAPSDTRVDVNETAFLACQASFSKRHRDLVYLWTLNGVNIDYNRDPSYRQDRRGDVSGLYIIGVQLRHAGQYTCLATTVDHSTQYSAYLDVHGPPGECVGVIGEVVQRSVTLTWITGSDHGANILSFRVDFSTDFNPSWRTIREGVKVEEVTGSDIDKGGTSWLRLTLKDLKPGISYRFRVAAYNRYGSGPPSWPTGFLKIPDSAPVVEVTGLREGISTVGTLPIAWDALSLEDLTGIGVGYKVYYRRKPDQYDIKWSMAEVRGHVNSYVAVVGADNYFLEYQVMVAPFNSLGRGPNSTVEILMSAEDMPVGAPSDVYADSYNGTAMLVYWNPIPSIRRYIRGRVLGYQINYWSQSLSDAEIGSTNIYCDCGEGLVVGLDPNDDYWINVQVFTNGGMGPLSEIGEGSTNIFPPLLYPEYVHVSSHRGDSVFVTWKAISTGLLEETLIGYKIRWWPATEDIRGANDTVVKDKMTHGIVRGIKRGTVYALRVLGYSNGGDGKKSSTVFFTLEGEVMYNFETTELMNASSQLAIDRPGLLFLVFILCFCNILWSNSGLR